MDGHAVSPFDLSRTLPVGGDGLLVPYSLSGSPVINHPLRPGTIVTICMSCVRNNGGKEPGKEHGTNKPPPTGRVRERSKGDTVCLSTSQNPSC